MWKVLAVAIPVLFIAGCGEPKLDGSSEAAMKKSVQEVSEKLPADKRKEFESDLRLIALSNVDMESVLRGEKKSTDVASDLLSSLNGKTAAEVSATASAIRVEREAKEKQQALIEIDELISKKARSEQAKSQLAKFTVSKSRFYLRDEKYSSQPQPVIEITVKNGTSQAVSRAYFKGTIASPGRSVPWLVEDFNYEISGGLEPGEENSWSLLPNRFNDWGKVDPPSDAVFTVEVVDLDGPDKKSMFDSILFTDANQKRLDLLRSRYQGQ